LRRGTKEKVVDDPLIGAGNGAQLLWEGEGDEEVMSREQEAFLLFEPDVGLVVAALWAVAVLAGVIAVAKLLALMAEEDLAAEGLCAAVYDVLHGPAVRGRHTLRELVEVVGTMQAKDLGQLDHLI
jgi:hypothetical protein